MADDRPLQGLLTEVQEGRLTLSMNNNPNYKDRMRANAEEFIYIERDCEGFKLLIRELQVIAREISEHDPWGLGEHDGILTSAGILVGRFRGKGKGADNSVHAILEQHYQIANDLQEIHRIIAQRYVAVDEEFAARYNELAAAPPPGPLGIPHVPNVFSGITA